MACCDVNNSTIPKNGAFFKGKKGHFGPKKGHFRELAGKDIHSLRAVLSSNACSDCVGKSSLYPMHNELRDGCGMDVA